MSILRALALFWLLRQAFRLARILLAASVLSVLWPVTVAAAGAASAAWLAGWPPARLHRAAAWSTVMAVVWLAGAALRDRTWMAIALAPLTLWHQASLWLVHGRVVPAVVLTVPLAVPAGLAAGGTWWGHRTAAMAAGAAGRHAFAPAAFDNRQWTRQARAARGRLAAPGPFPLVTGRGTVPAGSVIRTVGRPWRPVLEVPASAFRRHMVIIGSSGSGKTNLMIRLWAGWTAAMTAAARHGGRRPLLVAIDCKGGPDARAKADRTRRVLRGTGAGRVAVWPDDATLSLWSLPPQNLAVLLHQMVEHGTGGAAYYADITQAVLTLAVTAPAGPPRSAADFLARLDPGWLDDAHAGGTPAQHAALAAARPHLGDIQLRYATLLGRLGPALDGPGRLEDADAWYLILEGTSEPSVAEAQAMALTELVAHAATSRHTEPREILLAADDYSAVSRRVPLSNLYERGRSLGLGVMVSAQSWQGLGRDDDERYRIAATADGGLWVMQTPYPEPLSQLAGTRKVLESARKLLGTAWGDEGTSRIQHAWIADPDRIRQLDVGQACYIRRGSAAFIQITRPRPSPLPLPAALPAGPAAHAFSAPGRLGGYAGPPTLPLPAVPGDAPGPLDDVLGPDPRGGS